MNVPWRELRRGLAATWPFLLSHHEPSEYDRCYEPTIRGRTVRLCARCLGIYPGIAAGVVAYVVAPPPATSLALVAVLPSPALLDWSASALFDGDGSNPRRTATGALLGYAYGLGLMHLFDGRFVVLLVGLGYGLAAATLLTLHRRRTD